MYLKPLFVTAPDSGESVYYPHNCEGFCRVHVFAPGAAGRLAPQPLRLATYTENGTYSLLPDEPWVTMREAEVTVAVDTRVLVSAISGMGPDDFTWHSLGQTAPIAPGSTCFSLRRADDGDTRMVEVGAYRAVAGDGDLTPDAITGPHYFARKLDLLPDDYHIEVWDGRHDRAALDVPNPGGVRPSTAVTAFAVLLNLDEFDFGAWPELD